VEYTWLGGWYSFLSILKSEYLEEQFGRDRNSRKSKGISKKKEHENDDEKDDLIRANNSHSQCDFIQPIIEISKINSFDIDGFQKRM